MKALKFYLSFIVLLFVSCSTSKVTNQGQEMNELPTNETTQATLWVQNSAEYTALTRQTYETARRNLALPLEDSFWTASLNQENDDQIRRLPTAIILDVDETVLDNSPYQARLIKQNESFDPESWNEWCNEANASAIPGALSFTQYAANKGITVFYLTNREHSVEEATRKNLKQLGFPIPENVDVILTKGEQPEWTSSKVNRRMHIEKDYRVLMIFGDDLNDFISAKDISQAERAEKVKQYSNYFGRKWFVLPNPVYGSWEQALYGTASDAQQDNIEAIRYEKLRTQN